MSESATVGIPPERKSAREETGTVEATAPISSLEWKNFRLAQCVRLALEVTGYRVLRTVEVTVCAGMVTLGGRVPSYHLKQIAQTTALAVPGVLQVFNELAVEPR